MINSKVNTQNFLGDISETEFLQQYWQKKPLLIRNAFANVEQLISADELAGLALEQQVESRFISGHVDQGPESWQMQHGPFEESFFNHVASKNWTLLVQAVDHYIAEIAQFAKQFNFIPRWRYDDVMISFTTPGGSVGPHFDRYDVFLIQASGQRRWQLGGQCDDNSPLVKNCPLSILQKFSPEQEWVVNPGDLLYLPPALSHYGVALSDCITWSVGFRAPSSKDFLDQYFHVISRDLTQQIHYQDPDLLPPNNPALIDDMAIQRFQQILSALINDKKAIEETLGRLVSQPKYSITEDQHHDVAYDFTTLSQDDVFIKDESSRLFYTADSNGPMQLFVNGEPYPFPKTELGKKLILHLGQHEAINGAQLQHYQNCNQTWSWFKTLVQNGTYYYSEA